MSPASSGLAQSIQTRLLNYARAIGADPNAILARYGLERYLYRLARSPFGERFVLKGAMLLRVWLGETARPTQDADLLGYGDLARAQIERIFRAVCMTAVEPDGVSYESDSVRVSPIRPENVYGGQRVRLVGLLGRARLTVQIDVGIGDAISPEPEWLDYPSLLELPRPRLRAYRPETTVAEKLHAMAILGMTNSRLKDFYDLHELAMHRDFDGAIMAAAIRSTFERRHTSIHPEQLQSLLALFGKDAGKQRQWQGFLRKSRLITAPQKLAVAVEAIAHFLGPILEKIGSRSSFSGKWLAGGPWELGSDPDP